MKNIEGIIFYTLQECEDKFRCFTRETLLNYINHNNKLVAQGKESIFVYPTHINGHMYYTKEDIEKIYNTRKKLKYGYFKNTEVTQNEGI